MGLPKDYFRVEHDWFQGAYYGIGLTKTKPFSRYAVSNEYAEVTAQKLANELGTHVFIVGLIGEPNVRTIMPSRGKRKRRNPLFGFGRKPAAKKRVGKSAAMPVAEAVRAALKAGQDAGDTGAFDSWLSRSGLADRGALLEARLRASFERGVNMPIGGIKVPTEKKFGRGTHKFGESGYKDRKQKIQSTKKLAYHGAQIWWDGVSAWHTSIEPESEFDSKKDAKAFVKEQRKGNPVPDRTGVYHIPIHLSRAVVSKGSRSITLWKVLNIPSPIGWVVMDGVYATRSQAERKAVEVVKAALVDWPGKVELEVREVGRG